MIPIAAHYILIT